MQNTYISGGRIVAAIILVVLIVGGYFLWTRTRVSPAVTNATTTATTTSTIVQTATSSTGSSVAALADGAYTIHMVPPAERPTAPNYSAPLKFDMSASSDLRADLQTQFASVKTALTKEPMDFNAWLSLGKVRLIAGDEQGAKQVWEYVSNVWPTNEVSFNNLGDLYTNYLKDYAKAESNYLISIKNKPSNAAEYNSLFNLYYVLGYNKAKAEGILKQGIAAAPKAIDLQVLLARYYRDTGRTAEAKAEYDLAIKNAQSQNQTSLATTLQAESSAF